MFITRTVFGLLVALGVLLPARADPPVIPGYSGPIPHVPYLETQEQVRAALMAAENSAQMQRILEDYRRRAAPYFIEVSGGRLQVTLTPEGGEPKFVFFPNNPSPVALGSQDDYSMIVQFVDPKKSVLSRVSEATCFKAMRHISGMAQLRFS